MNYRNLFYLCYLFTCFHFAALAQNSSLSANIDQYTQDFLKLHEVPGAALAVIHDGKIIHQKYYGKASLESNTPVDARSMFRVYSTTKLLVAVGIFQLVEQGKISLEDAIGQYLPHLPKHWKNRKVKHLLTHSSGLPDLLRYSSSLTDKVLLDKLSSKPMEFQAGNQFRYNQTNYWLLAQIIAKVSKQTFENFILKSQLGTTQNKPESGVLFASHSKPTIPHRIVKYDYDNQQNRYQITTHNNGPRAHAANGLNISLQTMINWNKKLDQNALLRPATQAKMLSPFLFANKKDRFMHGWGVYRVNQTPSFGFTGGGVSGFRKFPKDKLTIIFFSNGFRYYPIHNQVINHIAGLVHPHLKDKKRALNQQLAKAFLQQNMAQAMGTYRTLKAQNPTHNFEGVINTLGYVFLRANKLPKATKLFQLNVKEYPASSNVYDSLGEAYFEAQNYPAAQKNYAKALELDPTSSNAKHMLAKIKNKMK
ncbi:MAG TPA: serine hydrolase [Microscillaceae bacterium]|nr:serine hydrolase [Microscillaceae bacterium]